MNDINFPGAERHDSSSRDGVRVAPRSTSKVEPEDALRVLAAALAPHLVELLGLNSKGNVDDWLDVVAELPMCKRALHRACRTGELPGRRIKRRWLVRRADLDAWVESHETVVSSALKPPVPSTGRRVASAQDVVARVLTPAELHEREMDALRAQLGGRRLTDAERAARGMPPYDVNREYEEFLARQREDEEERAAKERADNDPVIAAKRAAASRAADAKKRGRPFKSPRTQCARCGRTVFQGKDGNPMSHACPHEYGSGCWDVSGNSEGATPKCPSCAKERSSLP